MTKAVQIDLVASEAISYLAAYNGAPLVQELALRSIDGRSHTDLEVSVALTSPPRKLSEAQRRPHRIAREDDLRSTVDNPPADAQWGAVDAVRDFD